jgi:hypothetical protein
MAISNLSELRARIKDWANRSDISNDNIDNFINIALDRAVRMLRLPVLEATASLSVLDGGITYLPNDYLEAKELKLDYSGRSIGLERKDVNFVEKQRHFTGAPKYFARKLNQLIIAPAPVTGSSVDLYYYYSPDSLDEDTDTNWFVKFANDMLLYGALVELSLYIKNPEEALQWEAKFGAAVRDIQAMADNAEWSGSTITIRPQG